MVPLYLRFNLSYKYFVSNFGRESKITSEVASLHPPPAQVAVLRERRASSFVPAARDSGERERCAGGAVPAWQALRAAACARNSGRAPPLFPSRSTWFHSRGSYACARVRLRSSRRVSFAGRSEEHTSELQSLMRISYAVFCLKKKKNN